MQGGDWHDKALCTDEACSGEWLPFVRPRNISDPELAVAKRDEAVMQVMSLAITSYVQVLAI